MFFYKLTKFKLMGRRRLQDNYWKVIFIRERLPLEVPLFEPGYEPTNLVVTLEKDAAFCYFWTNIHGQRMRSWQNWSVLSHIYFEKYGDGMPRYTRANRLYMYVVPVDIAYKIAAGPKPMMWLVWFYRQGHLQKHPLMDVNLQGRHHHVRGNSAEYYVFATDEPGVSYFARSYKYGRDKFLIPMKLIEPIH